MEAEKSLRRWILMRWFPHFCKQQGDLYKLQLCCSISTTNPFTIKPWCHTLFPLMFSHLLLLCWRENPAALFLYERKTTRRERSLIRNTLLDAVIKKTFWEEAKSQISSWPEAEAEWKMQEILNLGSRSSFGHWAAFIRNEQGSFSGTVSRFDLLYPRCLSEEHGYMPRPTIPQCKVALIGLWLVD